MNERFLFRGKRVDNGEWAVGFYTWVISGTTGEEIAQILHGTDDAHPRYYNNVAPSTISQCTGLRAVKSYRGDKPEDLLVFEGDKLYATEWNSEWIVFWNNERASWMCRHAFLESDTEFLEEVMDAGPMIIGTIHNVQT